jgi:hypothetical protein
LFLESVRLGLDGSDPLRMFLLGCLKRRPRLVGSRLPLFTLLLPRGLFPFTFTIAALLLAFIRECRLPLRRFVGGP